MSALIFMDTETTGLSLDDDIWEFAAIRREEDGTESACHLLIEHDSEKCVRLPESFRADHERRFDKSAAVSPLKAALTISGLFADRPHVVGAVPNFDTERIALLLARFDLAPGWHYHLIDVENLAVGYLAGLRAAGGGENGSDADLPSLPWDSDDLSRACGVEPPTDERHTAMGDVLWARALYDAITAPVVASPESVEQLATACEWCGRAVERHASGRWYAVKGDERGYDPLTCEASEDRRHSPDSTVAESVEQP